MRVLFKVLWCFERIAATHDGGGLDDPMLIKLVGHHVTWWDELLQNVTETDVLSRRALRKLADWVTTQDPTLSAWAKADFPKDDKEQSVGR
jgi:hypothetical protein